MAIKGKDRIPLDEEQLVQIAGGKGEEIDLGEIEC